MIDEGDFRLSDETAEITKILNNGNAKGFPVLRSEATGKPGEFNPRAYEVYGPKLIGTRGYFQDRALESRCLTEETGGRLLPEDIPIRLPPETSRKRSTCAISCCCFGFGSWQAGRPRMRIPTAR